MVSIDAFDRLDTFTKELEAATAVATIEAALVRSVRQLGFDHLACSLIDAAANPRLPFFLTTYPDEWRSHYDRQRLSRHDPVFHHALRSTEPALWSDIQRRYPIPAAERLVFGPSAEFGLSRGGGLGARGPSGQIANLQVAGDGPAADFAGLFGRHRHELQLLTLYTHDRLLQLIGEAKPAPATLRTRQREVLRWAMHGKTNWEIGEILGISEDTVRQHLRLASRSLGASNRTHAVALAIVRGFISP